MTVLLIVVAIVVVLLAATIIWQWMRVRRTRRLQSQFGAEYDAAVEHSDGRREAESELQARQKRVEQLDIVPLSRPEAEEFARQWHDIQATFVERPSEAMSEGDRLITQVMSRRGYPMTDFEQRSADISVQHPDVVSSYRDAHAISVANAQGEANTEDLRRAMLHYRSLFTALIEEPDDSERRAIAS